MADRLMAELEGTDQTAPPAPPAAEPDFVALGPWTRVEEDGQPAKEVLVVEARGAVRRDLEIYYTRHECYRILAAKMRGVANGFPTDIPRHVLAELLDATDRRFDAASCIYAIAMRAALQLSLPATVALNTVDHANLVFARPCSDNGATVGQAAPAKQERGADRWEADDWAVQLRQQPPGPRFH